MGENMNELITSVARCSEMLNETLAERDAKSEFPFGLWQMMSETGVLGVPIDCEYGGMGQDIVVTMQVLEELGRLCEDAGFNFVLSSHIVSTEIAIRKFGSQAQKDRYLPGLCRGYLLGAHAITEPASGSDAFSMSTEAFQKGDKYVLSGSKVFITNAPIAYIFIVYAITHKAK